MDIATPSRFYITVAAVFSTAWCCAAGNAAEGQSTKPASSGTIHVVAQLHPEASDDNPGSVDKPFKTISRAAREVQPGDTVLIEDGVYREAVRIEANGTQEAPIVFAAALGARVVVTGTDVVTGWKKEEDAANIYSVPWTHIFLGWSKDRTHPADDYHLMIGRVEQVFVNGYSLLQVPSRSELTRGTFFVDENGKQLCVWDRTNVDIRERTPRVEASVRPVIWDCTGSFVITRGIRFCRAPSAAQSGSVVIRGNGDVIESCIIEEMNGAGLSFKGNAIVARACVLRNNGQMGFGASVKNFQMIECVVENNNTKNYARGWEAGGCKLVLCRNAVIEKSIFRDNRGNGVWFDIGNENCTVRNCLITNNEDAGIFYEISYGLRAHDNVIIGNGFARRPEAWGADAGIAISSSSRCVVERNLLIGNKEGFQFREQRRTTRRLGHGDDEYAIWNHDHTVRNNVIAYNCDLQTGGWFDVADASHWPEVMQTDRAEKDSPTKKTVLNDTDLDCLKQRPDGLSLEDLRLNLRDNLYAVRPHQRLYLWGCPWRKHGTYRTLKEVRRNLSVEHGSQLGDVELADWAARDLRVPQDSPAVQMKCYPQGEVPGVRLGVTGK